MDTLTDDQPIESVVADYVKARRPKVSVDAKARIRTAVNAASVHVPHRSIEYSETCYVEELMLIGLNTARQLGCDDRDPAVLDVVYDLVADALSPW